MTKTVTEYSVDVGGNTTVEYSDGTTNKFNITDAVTAQTNPVTGGVEFLTGGARIYMDSSLSLNSFGSPDVNGCWSAVFQAANDHLVSLAAERGTFDGLPSIRVQSAVFKMLTGVVFAPNVKFVAEGSFTLDFSTAGAGVGGISISGYAGGPASDSYGFTGHVLSAPAGTIHIAGPGREVSTAVAITIGNASAGLSICREVGLSNLSVTGWGTALEFRKYDTYLFHAETCRFERNFNGIKTPSGAVSNSGERMSFRSCVFAQTGVTGALVTHACDTFNLSFNDCSFDFFHTLLCCKSGATYAKVSFNESHMEGVDGYLVDWQSFGENFFVEINGGTILPTPFNATAAYHASPSRDLFNFSGSEGVEVHIDNAPILYTKPPITDYPRLSGGSVAASGKNLLKVTGHRSYSFNPLLIESIANDDHNFAENAAGTAMAALTGWSLPDSGNVSGSSVITHGGRNVLKITSTALVGSYAVLSSKVSFPVHPGGLLFTSAAVSLSGLDLTGAAAGDPALEVGVQFLRQDGSVLSTKTLATAIGNVFADSSAGNFGEGAARFISTSPFPFSVPPGARTAKAYCVFSKFKGDLLVSNLCVSAQ